MSINPFSSTRYPEGGKLSPGELEVFRRELKTIAGGMDADRVDECGPLSACECREGDGSDAESETWQDRASLWLVGAVMLVFILMWILPAIWR